MRIRPTRPRGKFDRDLREWACYHRVIASLPKRDLRFPKMTNAPAFSTVPVSPQRVTEK
ncbi:hypothetical protein OCU_18010 [Mycobacterium intracellulare ATCC 13950]|uniref:Uncharacterized protein n=1 Tax=Mycobacterium intracellulare (strain ATCC 13950 / DSM 43223 / JCM 6384 / NCTC 13025 / 3600) TaxID=487521 RepID=H8IQA8_MYCIA|nr:hypothetical protein OCU_18010 [Mycobacterium intracellulare ATCC 13950]ETZ37586.1 hypothetical protein L843_2020 [Mycobacterium intracellulare MIN_061107_1834]